MSPLPSIAYFSMEIGLEAGIPTYSGGLGILAGDTIRAAADLHVPMVGVTLLHRFGYFHQQLDSTGWQREQPVDWPVNDYLEELPQRVSVRIEGRDVALRAWMYKVQGCSGCVVPVLFLDSDLPSNSDWDRTLTHSLYGGDQRYRLGQEIILGIGGVRMLQAMGFDAIDRFHMNEGHAALLVLELLNQQAHSSGRSAIATQDIDAVRRRCVFTTHTPVPAGHDQFPVDLVERMIDQPRILVDWQRVVLHDNLFNLTYLALSMSRYVNGVAKKHGEISRLMFARYAIDSITNGVHAATWASPPMQQLFDRYIPDWRRDNFSLRYALSIPADELWQAHLQAKRQLIQLVNRQANAGLDVDALTIGFARRSTAYKRPDLIFHDLERLRAISTADEPLQLIFAGKAHPRDDEGKQIIQRILRAGEHLRGSVRVVYLTNYDMELARQLTAGVDVWLNTPQPPMEASGTSGMKAALNGVPSLSNLDGWWIEGCIERLTGWSIGTNGRKQPQPDDRAGDAASLYDRLEQDVRPTFYRRRAQFIDMMHHAISLNASFFNTQRMMQQYVVNAYFCQRRAEQDLPARGGALEAAAHPL